MATHELRILIEGLITKLKADADVISTFKVNNTINVYPWLNEKEYAVITLPLVTIVATQPTRNAEYSHRRSKQAAVILTVVREVAPNDDSLLIYNDLKTVQEVLETDENQEMVLGGMRFSLDDIQVQDPSEDDSGAFKLLNLVAIYEVNINT